jgi:hypothetical protein
MGLPLAAVSTLLNISTSSLKKWNRNSLISLGRILFPFVNSFSFPDHFNATGNVHTEHRRQSKSRWPAEVLKFVKDYAFHHPCFFLEELQEAIIGEYPDLPNVSLPTICRALRQDLKLTRKKLQKRARESNPEEIKWYKQNLEELYLYPEQLVFIDETSKDGRAALRTFAWSAVNTPAIVNLPFSRGIRVSALAGFNHRGFLAWEFTTGTFTRNSFHDAFVDNILPHLQPYPMPNSIVVIDNARIHMYSQFREAIESRGAFLIFLPPYSPQLNPIEVGFSLTKRYVEKNANLVFGKTPEYVLDLAFKACASAEPLAVNLFSHCGYEAEGLKEDGFGA